ncbi:MAG TPA: SRPBCC family protein [Anaerovoracaceae bacterium]|nr:SRPBCC family protein [Anaerovoracaceae bacterium]
MFKINKSILIDVPVDKVFGFLEDPSLLPEVWPSMVEIHDVQKKPEGGTIFSWVYKMGGIKIKGQSDTTTFEKNKHLITESKVGIQSKFDWILEKEDDKTKVQLVVEYAIPGQVLGKMAEPVLKKINTHEADVMLKNMKVKLEG